MLSSKLYGRRVVATGLRVDFNMLRELFRTVGSVQGIIRVDNTVSLIEFASNEEAREAVKEFNGKLIYRSKLTLRHAKHRPSYFKIRVLVFNLPCSVDRVTLQELFKSIDVNAVGRVMVNSLNRSLGFGEVQFSTEEQAIEAVEKFNGATHWDTIIEVRRWEPIVKS
jgi:RNA recognition motif-containing protein